MNCDQPQDNQSLCFEECKARPQTAKPIKSYLKQTKAQLSRMNEVQQSMSKLEARKKASLAAVKGAENSFKAIPVYHRNQKYPIESIVKSRWKGELTINEKTQLRKQQIINLPKLEESYGDIQDCQLNMVQPLKVEALEAKTARITTQQICSENSCLNTCSQPKQNEVKVKKGLTFEQKERIANRQIKGQQKYIDRMNKTGKWTNSIQKTKSQSFVPSFWKKQLEQREQILFKQAEQELQEEYLKGILQKHQEEHKEAMICKICYDEFEDINQMIAMENCEHFFHKECMMKYFEVEMEQNKIPFKCPIKECGHPDVHPIVLERVFSPKQLERYHQKTLSLCVDSNKNLIWCPTPDCKGTVEWTDNGDKTCQSRYLCKICDKKYCLECRLPYHPGITCEQTKLKIEHNTEDDKLFFDFVKNEKFKQCPQCNFWVQRTQGCNSMVCRCKFNFCYRCGKNKDSCDH